MHLQSLCLRCVLCHLIVLYVDVFVGVADWTGSAKRFVLGMLNVFLITDRVSMGDYAIVSVNLSICPSVRPFVSTLIF